MAKIDTSLIEGFDTMTPEEKVNALTSFEYEDNAEELERQKNAVTKANKEAAEWKHKHNALLSEDEKKKQEEAEALNAMKQELDDLRKEKTISDFKSELISQGYSAELAIDTAKAMAANDSATVFANQKKFLEEHDKQLKADALKKTPKPAAGGSPEGVDYDKLLETARNRGDMTAVAYYTRLKAEEEAAQANNE